MEDIVIVESKDYAQVVFDDIKECFAENQPLECTFTLNELLKVDKTDWIGIFKVGFSNSKDFLCTQHVDVESIKENKAKVIFPSEELPKDDGEFYQFVYVSQGKHIRGASIPFQFKRTHISDYVEIEEPEAIVIKTKENAIHESLEEIKSRCDNLTQSNEVYEKLISENENLIQSLKEEIATVKSKCLRLTLDNEKLNYTLKMKVENLKNMSENISFLSNENKQLQIKFDELTNENKSLSESLQERCAEIEQLKTELSSLKMEQIGNLEKQVEERVEQLNQLKNDLKKNESVLAEQAQTIFKVLNERDELTKKIEILSKSNSDLEFNQENLLQELNMYKDKLAASEQSKQIMNEQMSNLNEELEKANGKIESLLLRLSQTDNMKNEHELEKAQLVDQMEKMKQDYEAKIEESKGSYYALKLAHLHLENKLKSNEQAKSKSEHDIEYYKHNLKRLEQENEELTERLKAGGKEYSKLFEKYRFIKNQQFNYDMNVYQDLNGGNDIRFRKNANGNERMIRSSTFGTSTPMTESSNLIDIDSAVQDKTASQNARASSADIENTLLDALLASSFYNGWRGTQNATNTSTATTTNTNESNINALKSLKMSVSSIETVPIATIIQPKMCNISKSQYQTSDISDDGLLVNQKYNSSSTSNDDQLKLRQDNLKPLDFGQLNKVEEEEAKNMIKNTNLNINTCMSREDDDNVFTETNTNIYKFIQKHRNSTNVDTNNEIRSCDICNYMFPTESTVADIEKHYSIHYGPSCPVCFLLFRKGYPQNEFEEHVNSHFTN